MSQDDLRELLDRLREELGSTDQLDGETRAHVQLLIDDVSALLERSEEAPSDEHASMDDRLGIAAQHFSASHPNIAGAIGRVATALSKIGI